MIILKYPTYEDKIATIENDMVANNEAALMNIAADDTRVWLTTKGSITMGYFPRGDNAPSWWQPTGIWTTPPDVLYTTDTRPWEAITPWFVTSKGAAHAATNTRINIGGIVIQLYDKSVGAWKEVASGNPTWAINYDYSDGTVVSHGPATYRTESDGSRSFQFQSNSAAIHGGTTRFVISDTIPDYNDIGGVFVRIVSRLVLDDVDGVDDRADAQILMNAAADFWPTASTTLAQIGIGYIPNIGISRFKSVTIIPQEHFMAAVSPPTAIGGSAYVTGGGLVTMPVATLESHWPPYIR